MIDVTRAGGDQSGDGFAIAADNHVFAFFFDGRQQRRERRSRASFESVVLASCVFTVIMDLG